MCRKDDGYANIEIIPSSTTEIDRDDGIEQDSYEAEDRRPEARC